MSIPKAPAVIQRSASAKKAWQDIWSLLKANDMDDEIYAPMVLTIAMELALVDDASNAIFRPMNADTGKRSKRTLEQYLAGRNSQTIPELTLLRESLKSLAKLVAEFGTSPLSQKRVGGISKQPEESPMMQYIKAANERMRRRVS